VVREAACDSCLVGEVASWSGGSDAGVCPGADCAREAEADVGRGATEVEARAAEICVAGRRDSGDDAGAAGLVSWLADELAADLEW
jgi:hypothetical protein